MSPAPNAVPKDAMRIWVARAEPAAERTARRLRAIGHDPLVAPVFRIAFNTDPPLGSRFDGIVLTSANAVAPLVEARLESAPIFAVGNRTAALARAAGLDRVLASDGDATALGALIRETLPAGATLLHVAGEDRKPEPEASLRAAGYRLSVWAAYAARPVDALPSDVASGLARTDNLDALDAALHYSRRSAAIALMLVREAGQEAAFRDLRHYCLSADVAVPLVEAGIPAHFVAARPDEDSLLAGLAAKP